MTLLHQDWASLDLDCPPPSPDHYIIRERRGTFKFTQLEPVSRNKLLNFSPGTNPWNSSAVKRKLPDFYPIMATTTLQRTHSLLLLLLLTLLGLGLVQPSYGQSYMYQRFLRQHVDPSVSGGNDGYCNVMMQRRKMIRPVCKQFNTFIHEDIGNINSICSTANIQCKNGSMNCHQGVVKVTDCKVSGSSRSPNCRYRALASTRRVVIACEGTPELPVHFDR
ncbi:ribonuclease 4 isoform X2 [Erinaceus europaeus]|uniref:Ribonuclease 4 n=1 Tax=Erinaceus europaeus TaxID=9365 RepID=A0A1S3WVG1_ERIEU|nr:ribonuclease 4 isoform X2 [Erinaceus europaeus]